MSVLNFANLLSSMQYCTLNSNSDLFIFNTCTYCIFKAKNFILLIYKKYQASVDFLIILIQVCSSNVQNKLSIVITAFSEGFINFLTINKIQGNRPSDCEHFL